MRPLPWKMRTTSRISEICQMENIEVTGCRQFTKIEPLQGRPETIQNVVINGQKLA